MAEYWFFGTGANPDMQLFIQNMNSQAFHTKLQGPMGEQKQDVVYGALQPITLYRYIFPDEGINIVNATLTNINTSGGKHLSKIPKTAKMAIRKALQLQNYQEIQPIQSILPVWNKHLWIQPIGYKTDKERVFKETGQIQKPF